MYGVFDIKLRKVFRHFLIIKKKVNSKLIAGVISSIVIAIIIVAVVFTSPKLEKIESKDPFENWNKSGPFGINKFQYKLGEKVFFVANGLSVHDIGKVIVGLPNGTTIFTTIPFDGTTKSEFNTYFAPALSKTKKICSTDDIVGDWYVVFRDTSYAPIRFKVINETIDESEIPNFVRVC